MSRERVLYTVGHSTRTEEEFLRLLKNHGIERLLDVRSVPKSARNPQFAGELLARSLPRAGIAYEHVPEAGGLRAPRKDSPNTGWKNKSFRGYADHMAGAEFRRGFDRIAEIAADRRTAVMCAEAVPWRCHRNLLSDAFVAAGWEVRHIMSEAKTEPHRPTPFMRVKGGVVTYPRDGAQPLPLG